MPRFRLSLSDLTAMVNSRRRELSKLHKHRRLLQRDLDRLDRAIARIEGTSGRGFRGERARNELSLSATIAQVLGEASEPMTVADIVQGVQGTGYRSGSANFRSLVNMTLVKDDRFRSVSRGVYALEGQGDRATHHKRKQPRSTPKPREQSVAASTAA